MHVKTASTFLRHYSARNYPPPVHPPARSHPTPTDYWIEAIAYFRRNRNGSVAEMNPKAEVINSLYICLHKQTEYNFVYPGRKE